MSYPKTTPVYREDGSRYSILGMAASSIGRQTYQVSACECGAKVAWAKSSKTGRWYICETAEYSTEAAYKFRAVPYKFHTCRPASTETYTDRADRHAALLEANEARSAERRAMGDD